MLGIIIRPQIVKTQTGPSTQWTLEPTTDFPNGLMAAGSGFGINANLLGGIPQSAFQKKIITKYASKSYLETPDQTTALPSAPVAMPNASVSFTSDDIKTTSNLIINWSALAYNGTAGVNYGVETHVLVDGNEATTTHISQPISGGAWMQHSANAVVPVSAGAHTVSVTWNVFWAGGTGTVGSRNLVVTAIPE